MERGPIPSLLDPISKASDDASSFRHSTKPSNDMLKIRTRVNDRSARRGIKKERANLGIDYEGVESAPATIS